MLKVETEREEDGRWIAEVPLIPGVLAYAETRAEAIAKAEALALRTLADRLDHGEEVPDLQGLFAARPVGRPASRAGCSTRCCILVGVSNGSQAHTEYWNARVGRMWCLPFTTETRSAHVCSPVSPSTRG